MANFLLALDQGTTSSRAILFDDAGSVRAIEQQEFPQIYPHPGWVEHSPEAIWKSQIEVTQRLLSCHGVGAHDVAAIGITNQRETTVLWERATGKPVGNAIVWQDRRTADRCVELRAEGLESMFRSRTGLPIDPYFSGTKLEWMLANLPGVRARAEAGELAFGTVDSFLISRLTGGAVHATDVSNASRTLLFNISTGDWDDDLLRILNVPRAVLPRVLPSSGNYGETSIFGPAIPISGVAGDQQAATFGQACHQPGMVKNTYGTGSFLLANTGATPVFSDSGLLTTVAWQLGTKSASANPLCYALEGSAFVTGAAVQWLRDELGIIATAADIESLAQTVEDNGGVYFVPAFTGLGTPYWDPYARGAILGLTRGAGKAHLARATLEAVCFQTAEIVQVMQLVSGNTVHELRVDGGMTVNNTLLQMQSDLLGIPVVRPQVRETTALGAAYLAGLAVGFWNSPEQIASQWAVDRVFLPNMDDGRRAEMMENWRRAVSRARDWARD